MPAPRLPAKPPVRDSQATPEQIRRVTSVYSSGPPDRIDTVFFTLLILMLLVAIGMAVALVIKLGSHPAEIGFMFTLPSWSML